MLSRSCRISIKEMNLFWDWHLGYSICYNDLPASYGDDFPSSEKSDKWKRKKEKKRQRREISSICWLYLDRRYLLCQKKIQTSSGACSPEIS